MREEEGYTFGMGGVQTVCFVGDGHANRDAFDTVIVLSPEVAAAKIYPAIDPLTSGSRWLDPAVVGDAHASVAACVRACLAEDGPRARKLRRFFSQPFFIAEPYTKQPGSFVPRADAIAACAAIVDGVHDDVPEEAFAFTGGIDQVLARR